MKLSINPNDYRACPLYNEWLDEQFFAQFGKTLDIFGYQPTPSFVLFAMSPDTYEAAFEDFKRQRGEEIKDYVCNYFPSPIAYYFYRFENGYEHDLQRLHFLRDTWESVIDVLHALAVAEFRHYKLPSVGDLRFKDLLSDKVAQRLKNIRAIIEQLSDAGITSCIGRISSASTLDAMRELNQSRNAFSHSAAQSETQARNWINDCYDDVLEILSDLGGLREILLVRYLDQVDALTLRCEVFKGHSSTKTIQVIKIESRQLTDSVRYFQKGKILSISGELIFGLSPMIHFREDHVGHTTRLCTFRKTHGDGPDRCLEYGVIGEAASYEESRSYFHAELTELRSLFGLAAD